jgi:hypothetical protein
MNSSFDLNLSNYTIAELEDIFELPPNYNETMVDTRRAKLIKSITHAKDATAVTKKQTLNFVNQVAETLIERKRSASGVSNVDLIKTYEHVYNLDKTMASSIVDGNNIIQRPTTAYGQSMPSEFYQGVINPLTKRILRQNINIDTRFRENYYATTSSNFHVDLPLKLNKVVSLQLSALELPNTFYAISQVFGNHFFKLEIPGEPPQMVIIPDGNYDYIGLQTYINHFLTNTASAYSQIQFLADSNTPEGAGYLCGSGRMVVTSSVQFSMDFGTDSNGQEDKSQLLPLKLGWQMGFRCGLYENNTSYVSEGIINLTGSRYIYLVVDDFNNNVLDGFYGAFTSSILNKNILARISLQGSVFNYLSKDNFNLITTPRQYFGPVDIQKLQIQLLDEYGRILNLNNMDYSFCLTFQTMYDL